MNHSIINSVNETYIYHPTIYHEDSLTICNSSRPMLLWYTTSGTRHTSERYLHLFTDPYYTVLEKIYYFVCKEIIDKIKYTCYT